MASDSSEIQLPQNAATQAVKRSELDALRTLLLQEEQTRIHALEQETTQIAQASEAELAALLAKIEVLQSTLFTVQKNTDAQQVRADGLQSQLDDLRHAMQVESDALEPRLVQKMGSLISQTIRHSRDEMAAALGPIMGLAIREQIRSSRKSMVEALYPIIIETVQRALAAFARELQQNIDARLKSTFRTDGMRRRMWARLQGVSPSELAMRDALPFEIQEVFLIQRGSGLLIEHVPIGDENTADSDLVSGMLTAIRDFAQDSFGEEDDGQELDEFQYGDERIIIRSGRFAYLAVMSTGIEPSGFRTNLLEFVSELHLEYSTQLEEFDGDPDTVPEKLRPQIADLAMATSVANDQTAVSSRQLSAGEKRLLWGGGLAGILLLIVGCFYLQFTIALWPIAFGSPTATSVPAMTITLPTTEAAGAIPMNTETAVSPPPTITSTTPPSPAIKTPSPLPTETLLPTATPLPTYTPTLLLATSKPDATSRTNAPVWVRGVPDINAEPAVAVDTETAVRTLSQFGEWVEIEWQTEDGLQRGWVGIQWVNLSQSLPDELITPFPDN